jgi:hypothetical protein
MYSSRWPAWGGLDIINCCRKSTRYLFYVKGEIFPWCFSLARLVITVCVRPSSPGGRPTLDGLTGEGFEIACDKGRQI